MAEIEHRVRQALTEQAVGVYPSRDLAAGLSGRRRSLWIQPPVMAAALCLALVAIFVAPQFVGGSAPGTDRVGATNGGAPGPDEEPVLAEPPGNSVGWPYRGVSAVDLFPESPDGLQARATAAWAAKHSVSVDQVVPQPLLGAMVTATTKLAVFQIGLINETAHLVTYVETPAGKSIIRDEVLPAGIDQISGEVLLGTARYIFVLGRPDIRRIEYAADGKRFVTPVTVPVSSVAEGWAIFKAGGESAQERIRLSRCSGCQADYLGPIDRSDA